MYSVFLEPTPNLGIPVLFFLLGTSVILLFPVVFIVEGFVLKLMKWDTFGRSLVDSFIVNFISSALGAAFACNVITSTPGIPEILLSWVLSFAIEFCGLWVFRKHTLKFVLSTSFYANTASYIGILLFYLIFIPPISAFPNTDIVYVVNSSRTELGFVNQDGSGKQILNMDTRISHPYWSRDERTIYLLETGQGIGLGDVSIWKEGKRKHTCIDPDWGYFSGWAGFTPNSPSTAIVTSHYNQIWLIDLQKCQKIDAIVDELENLNGDSRVEITGGSLSPDGNYLLFTKEVNRYSANHEYSILKMDLKNGETIALGEGAYPRWSPDGSKIAYLQLDGIYVMLADGTQSKRIVAHDLSEAWS